jgi:hypothetical protein
MSDPKKHIPTKRIDLPPGPIGSGPVLLEDAGGPGTVPGKVEKMDGVPVAGEQLGRGDPPAEPARYHPEVEARVPVRASRVAESVHDLGQEYPEVVSRTDVPRGRTGLDEELRERMHGRRVGPTEDQLQGLADSLEPKEQERLIAILQQRLGLVGKAPTGTWIAKVGIMLDARPGQAKAQRIRPGTVLADLSAEEIDLFKGQGAIEPEYS